MAKLILSDVGSLVNHESAREAINNNFTEIEQAVDELLSRDGTTPNQMTADLDMNSKRIMNVADAITDGEAVNVRTARVIMADAGSGDTAIRQDLAQVGAGKGTELVAYTPPSTGVLGTVKGFLDSLWSTDSALGAALIRYVPTSTGLSGSIRSFLESLWTTGESAGAALIRYVQSGTGATARTVQSKLRDHVSVFDFMTADQIADTQLVTPVLDHTAALQAALDAMAIPLVKDSARLHIPAGRYRISSELVVEFNGVLYGDGVETTVITLLNATQNGISVPYSGTLQIHGIHIKADVAKTAGAGIKVSGISASSASSQTRIFNCKVDQQYIGIDMANSGFWSIRDTIVSDAYIGIRSDNTQNFDGGDNVIGEGTIIYRTGSDATAGTRGIEHVGSGGLKLIGVKILGYDRGYELHPRAGATYVIDTQIVNCSMEFQNICIALDTQTAGTSIAQFTITGNQLHPRTHGVYLRGNVGGGTVANNIIGVQFADAIGVFLTTDGTNTPGNIAFTGNTIVGNSSAGSIGFHGGFLATTNGNVLYSNRISGVVTDTVAWFGRQTDVTYTFANLPGAADGSIVYCSDGTIANPVAGGGTGCIAKRINGVWVGN